MALLALFWLSFGILVWCFVGYPLALSVRAKLHPRPLRAANDIGSPAVSVLLAVRNGVEHLRHRVENLLALDYPADRLEVVVVCNGCTDGTEELARRLEAEDGRIRVLTSPATGGKSGALNVAAAHAGGEFLVFADVRQSFAPDALRRLLEPFADPEVGAVSGRLVLTRAGRPGVEGVRWYWGYETALRMAESRTGSVVGATGAIYAIRRELFEPLPANVILDDVFTPCRIAMRGFRVVLAEGAVAIDTAATHNRHEFERKRRTMWGNLQLLRLLPQLGWPWRNPIWGRFVSHKVMRLLLPFAALGMLVPAALLGGPVFRAVSWIGVCVYALGVLGLIVRVRAFSPAAAFVLIQAAIIAAFLRIRHDPASVWTARPSSRPVRVRTSALPSANPTSPPTE
ncbi:MAG: glycosyltransferase family 2 protein [Gemmatimonadetes bacterium]|nr:glycosyltransferase family 2 protein [Gemmatimonadota bacterium]